MFANTLKLALQSVRTNKMRSALTMLGIIIGVMAVVILVSITQNATTGITESISEMGSVQITATITDGETTLQPKDAETLAAYPSITAVAPVLSSSATVKHKENSASLTVVGVTCDYFTVQDLTVQSGRILHPTDLTSATAVAVIGTECAEKLFGTWDAVGGTITIGERNYTVVGVLAEQGSSLTGSDDSKILIPYDTAARKNGESGATTLYIRATDAARMDNAIAQVSSFLLMRTRDEEAYTVNNQSDVLDTMSDVSDTLSLLLAGIAAISLLVGGIGIMNIMLVSVTERTREIGIRKAVGAKRRHILLQFLCESCLLSLLGGLIGLGASAIGVWVYNQFAASGATVAWSVGFAALGFCVVIGVLFGSYPAAKASRLQPIDALHG